MQGIYSITNRVDGKVYIGQDTNIPNRRSRHKGDLQRGRHTNPYLQLAYNKYGVDAFVYDDVVCGPFDKDELTELEQFHIDRYKALGLSYNLLPATNSRVGMKNSDRHKQIMSLRMRGSNHPQFGKHPSTETLKKIDRKSVV